MKNRNFTRLILGLLVMALVAQMLRTIHILTMRAASTGIDIGGGASVSVDMGPDAIERAIYLAAALLLGAVATWSRSALRLALSAGVVLYSASILLCLFSNNYPSSASFVAAGIGLTVALILHLRGASSTLIAMICPSLVVLEFGIWAFETAKLRSYLEVEALDPPTLLNNTLVGGSWWDVVTVACSAAALLLNWCLRPVLRHAKERLA